MFRINNKLILPNIVRNLKNSGCPKIITKNKGASTLTFITNFSNESGEEIFKPVNTASINKESPLASSKTDRFNPRQRSTFFCTIETKKKSKSDAPRHQRLDRTREDDAFTGEPRDKSKLPEASTELLQQMRNVFELVECDSSKVDVKAVLSVIQHLNLILTERNWERKDVNDFLLTEEYCFLLSLIMLSKNKMDLIALNEIMKFLESLGLPKTDPGYRQVYMTWLEKRKEFLAHISDKETENHFDKKKTKVTFLDKKAVTANSVDQNRILIKKVADAAQDESLSDDKKIGILTETAKIDFNSITSDFLVNYSEILNSISPDRSEVKSIQLLYRLYVILNYLSKKWEYKEKFRRQLPKSFLLYATSAVDGKLNISEKTVEFIFHEIMKGEMDVDQHFSVLKGLNLLSLSVPRSFHNYIIKRVLENPEALENSVENLDLFLQVIRNADSIEAIELSFIKCFIKDLKIFANKDEWKKIPLFRLINIVNSLVDLEICPDFLVTLVFSQCKYSKKEEFVKRNKEISLRNSDENRSVINSNSVLMDPDLRESKIKSIPDEEKIQILREASRLFDNGRTQNLFEKVHWKPMDISRIGIFQLDNQLDQVEISRKIDLKRFAHLSKIEQRCLVRILFLNEITAESDSIHIYTDGSKTKEGTGAAVYEETTRAFQKIRLDKSMSSHTAELTALHQAVASCLDRQEKKFLIFSDSREALEDIACQKASANTHYLALKTLNLLEIAKQQGKSVEFFWIPAHKGIPGNEVVDEMAKDSILNGIPFTLPRGKKDTAALYKITIIRNRKEVIPVNIITPTILLNYYKLLNGINKDHPEAKKLGLGDKLYNCITRNFLHEKKFIKEIPFFLFIYSRTVKDDKEKFYKKMVDDIVEQLLKDKTVTIEEHLYKLLNLSRMRTFNTAYVEFCVTHILKDKNVIEKSIKFFELFLESLAESDFPSKNKNRWPFVRSFINDLSILSNKDLWENSNFEELISIVIHLTYLGIYSDPLIAYVSQEVNNNPVKFLAEYEPLLLILNQALNVLHPSCKENLLSKETLARSKTRNRPRCIFEEDVKSHLESGKIDENIVLDNCYPKLGLKIDLVLALNEQNRPFSFPSFLGQQEKVFIDDIAMSLPASYQLLFICLFKKKNCLRETEIPLPLHQLKLKTFEAMGYVAVPILESEWDSIENGEKTTYLWKKIMEKNSCNIPKEFSR